MKLYRVVLPFATFGFEVESGRVSRIAPIARYAAGWTEEEALAYFRKRGHVARIGP